MSARVASSPGASSEDTRTRWPCGVRRNVKRRVIAPPGWLDMFPDLFPPGSEHVRRLARSSVAGGASAMTFISCPHEWCALCDLSPAWTCVGDQNRHDARDESQLWVMVRPAPPARAARRARGAFAEERLSAGTRSGTRRR